MRYNVKPDIRICVCVFAIMLQIQIAFGQQNENTVIVDESSKSKTEYLFNNKVFKIEKLSTQDTLSVLSFIILLLATVYAYRQYKQSKVTSRENSYLKTIELLQEEKFIEARKYVLSNLTNKAFEKWDDNDLQFAETVCRNYDFAYLMNERLNMAIVNTEIASKWNYSIKKCYLACQPLIQKYQEERDINFWNHFDKLYELANITNSNIQEAVK